jgi:hypothetical protein
MKSRIFVLPFTLNKVEGLLRFSVQHLVICFFILTFFSYFVSFSSAGQLVYSTYLGGGTTDYGYGIAIDSSGNAYITGVTGSTDFPTTPGAFDTSLNNLNGVVFVTKLNASGTALVYSTYLGGGDGDASSGIAIDGSGNAYITGKTISTDFPTTPGAMNISSNGYWDVFVTKLNASGTALVYSTYLGSSGYDVGYGIAIDSSGNAYITGGTDSSNFPTTPGAFDTSSNGGAFVSKLNASGTALVYSTYLGSADVFGIAIDSSGNAYITGVTGSSDFPTTPSAFDTSFNGGTYDVFVSKLNPSGTALVYSTYLGGGSSDVGSDIAIDGSGNAYITGATNSSDFPTTPSAFDTSFNYGYNDVFVSKLNASGTALVYSTYLGGGSDDGSGDIAIDSSGNAYITGGTNSTDFPTTPGAFDTSLNNLNGVVFVTKLNASGTALVYSTYLGGGDGDASSGIAIDGSGNAYITGDTISTDFPTTPSAFDTSFNGGTYDVFVTKLRTVQPPPTLGETVFYSDMNNNTFIDVGDTLTMQFDRRMQVNSATASDFYLPVTGDNLGTGATVSINTANDTQVVITLGSSPTLLLTGVFSGNTTAGSPSAIDISTSMTLNAIEDIYGNDAESTIPQDIRYTVLGTSTTVSANSSAIIQVSQDTLNAYYTGHKLVIPTNSLTTGATITIGAPGDNHGELSAVSLNPPQVTFSSATPATIVIEYKDADTKIDAGYMETAMRIHQWKDSTTGWLLIPETYGNQSVDLILKTVSVNINKFNMIGSNTTIVYANIALPSVGVTSTVVAPAPSGFRKAGSYSSWTTITLSVTTEGIYTKHKLVLTDYTTSYSGTTVILIQATLPEMHDWQNYAVLKIVTLGEITTTATLTMEYKDHDDANNQFKNDVIGGTESQMRIYRWRNDLSTWEKIPGTQSVNKTENLVTVPLDSISTSQIYAVKVDTSEISVEVDYPWERYH